MLLLGDAADEDYKGPFQWTIANRFSRAWTAALFPVFKICVKDNCICCIGLQTTSQMCLISTMTKHNDLSENYYWQTYIYLEMQTGRTIWYTFPNPGSWTNLWRIYHCDIGNIVRKKVIIPIQLVRMHLHALNFVVMMNTKLNFSIHVNTVTAKAHTRVYIVLKQYICRYWVTFPLHFYYIRPAYNRIRFLSTWIWPCKNLLGCQIAR